MSEYKLMIPECQQTSKRFFWFFFDFFVILSKKESKKYQEELTLEERKERRNLNEQEPNSPCNTKAELAKQQEKTRNSKIFLFFYLFYSILFCWWLHTVCCFLSYFFRFFLPFFPSEFTVRELQTTDITTDWLAFFLLRGTKNHYRPFFFLTSKILIHKFPSPCARAFHYYWYLATPHFTTPLFSLLSHPPLHLVPAWAVEERRLLPSSQKSYNNTEPWGRPYLSQW